ncbi:MAG: DNA gyrase inhibitor YacG [Rhodospirillales bacterium]
MSPSSPRPTRPCPICGKQAVDRYRPFCSKRCADIDLGRWLGGDHYRIPIADEDTDEDEDTGIDPGDTAAGNDVPNTSGS